MGVKVRRFSGKCLCYVNNFNDDGNYGNYGNDGNDGKEKGNEKEKSNNIRSNSKDEKIK